MSILTKEENKFMSEKNKSRNIIKNNNFNNLNKYNKVGYISYTTNLPNLSDSKKSNNINNVKNKNSTVNNLNNNSIINFKKNLNYFTPETSSKFKKISPFKHFSPLINNKIGINYFNEIGGKKFAFSLKKSNSLQNLKIPNNNAKKVLNINNNSIYNNSKKIHNYYSSFNNNNYSTQKNNLKFSSYYFKSKNSLYSSRRIFRHYINESENDRIIPEKFFYKGGIPKPLKKIEEFYKLNLNYHRRLEEMKSNKTLAFKKDFNIMKYQTTLLKLISKKVSDINLRELQGRFIKFNEKVYGPKIQPRGRFTNLAEKIKNNIPSFLYEKIKKLDKEKLMSRYNYFKKIHENIHSNYEKLQIKREKEKKNKNKSTKKIINFNNSF